jgi:hypothetical protein
MNKKSVIVAVVAIALMLAGIAWAVYKLYSKPQGTDIPVKSDYSLLKAVPSDAAVVFAFDGSREARGVIADSCGVLQSFLQPGAFMEYLSAVGAKKTVVSLHNSGALVPLIIAEEAKPDSLSRTQLESLAAAASLKVQYNEGLVLASRSETLLAASVRHMDSGLSVLSAPGMKEACASVSGPAIVFLNNSQGAKLLQTYGGAAVTGQGNFVRHFADWTSFRMEADAQQIALRGTVTILQRTAGYMTAYSGAQPVAATFASVLPGTVASVLAIPVADADDYLARYRDYRDSGGKLRTYDADIDNGKGHDISPRKWYQNLQLKEIVRASFRNGSTTFKVLMLRCAQDGGKKGSVEKNAYAGYPARVLGSTFQVEDSLCLYLGGGWRVYGCKEALDMFQDKEFLTLTLKDRLSEAGLQIPTGMIAYASLSDAPEIASRYLDDTRTQAVLRYTNGASYAPVIAALKTGSTPSITLTLSRRMEQQASKGGSFLKDTTVVVPQGPYDVINHNTGKINHLYQNKNLYICLNDENGKGVWGIPFSKHICGRVECIDYYNNGRKQFLFGAGSSIYLLDVKGRFVQGFPVDLGRDIRLGPAAYDFTGAGGYTIMVLHKNNTLQMYNLHGQKPQNWKGIVPEDKIRDLPELYESEGKRYWIVTTSGTTAVYPFNGGEPLTRKETEKLLKKK